MNNENSTFSPIYFCRWHCVRTVYDWNFKLLSVGTELVYFKCNFHQCTFNPNLLIYADIFLLSWFWKETKRSKMGSNNAWFVQFWIIKQLDWKNNRSQKTSMNISIYIRAVCIYDLSKLWTDSMNFWIWTRALVLIRPFECGECER